MPETQSARRHTGVSFPKIAFRVSHTLARRHSNAGKAVQVLQESRRFNWIRLRILTAAHPHPQRWEFAWPTEYENEVILRANAQTDLVSVDFDGAVPAGDGAEATILLRLVAQQVALFVHREELARSNHLLKADCRVMGERVDLAKFMDRAKGLMIRRRGLSAGQAEEWLVGASVRFGKPLLNVARDIVTALSTPGFAA